MASTYSSNLKIELIANGEQSGTWGTTTNNNLGTALEESIVGRGVANFTADADLTLTLANSNASQVARAFVLNVTSGVSLTATRNLIVPTINKPYIVQNATTGGQSIVVKTATGTGITVPNGNKAFVYTDGTNVVSAIDYLPSLSLGAALAAASGGTGLTSPGTSGNVLTSTGTGWTSSALPAGGITYVVKTSAYTAVNKDGIVANTTGGAFTINLPATPSAGWQVFIADGGAWGTNNLTVGRNGSTIEGLAEDMLLDITGASCQFVYDGSTWQVYAQIGGNNGTAVTLTGVQTLTNKTLADPKITIGGSNGTTGQALVSQGAGVAPAWSSIGIGQVSTTVTANTTLTSASAGYQFVQMASLGQSITLPDATTLTVGGPRYIIDNTKGGYPCGIRDNTGTLIMAVAAGGEAYVALKDASTAAGSWSVTGSNLEPGLITIDSTFSSTYASTVLAPFVALDNNTSIHFAALASGFAAFVVDNTGKVLTTPVTVSSTASDVPVQCFKVSATSAIVFYGKTGTNTHNAVVLTVSGSSPSLSLAVGTPQTFTASASMAAWGGENFVGQPCIAQLSLTLYVAANAASATTTGAVAISVSGTSVTIGAMANIVASAGQPGSVTTYPLTASTALVLYKTGTTAPYANNAVVISVSGTTCTVNTPVALSGVTSSVTSPPPSVLVSATKCIVADDINTSGQVWVQSATISGTTVSAGTAVQVDSANGWITGGYTASNATRYNPHLWTLTTGATNTVGLWYLDTSYVSRVVVLSETSGTITAGTIVYRSISGIAGGNGGGLLLGVSASDMLILKSDGTSTGAGLSKFVTSKLSGTTVTVGNSVGSQSGDLQSASYPQSLVFGATRLNSGDYVVGPCSNTTVGNSGIPVIRANGDAINHRGSIKCPQIAIPTGQAFPVQSNGTNRVMLLGSTQPGGTAVNATTYQLRLLNVEIAA